MSEPWTIRRVLEWTTEDFRNRGLASPRLDAELLLAHTLGLERVGLYLDYDRPLSPDELGSFRRLVARRREYEPVAYILGRREFYGRPFRVRPAVLVPRPETEVLVERAIQLIGETSGNRILDLCTGSGIIGLSICAECPDVACDLTDISAEALEVAKENAVDLGVADRASFFTGDLFGALPSESIKYDLITANPPYVREDELPGLSPDIVRYEPHQALVAGPDGLSTIRRIVEESPRYLRAGCHLLMEIAEDQAPAVLQLLAAHPDYAAATSHRDLAGIERVIEARSVAAT